MKSLSGYIHKDYELYFTDEVTPILRHNAIYKDDMGRDFIRIQLIIKENEKPRKEKCR